jgi:menaquinone-9 beta-reductase
VRLEAPLIVGAGPAGCAAAIALARGGARPVVLERSVETGDALCGGFLSWRTMARLDALGIGDFGAHRIDTLRVFHRDRQASARLPGLAIGVSRHRLDTRMQEVAVAAGCELRRGVSARGYGDRAVSTDSGDFPATTLFLATGKHELRGLSRPKPEGDAPLGLRVRIPAHPSLAKLVEHAIELHLFEGGYAGLLLQEDGSANLCMALRKSRFAGAGGDPAVLLRQLGDAHPHLGDRLAYLGNMPKADAIGAVPYGWCATDTTPGLFRLGDQAAVIPSLAGEGMGIAIASGMSAARAYLDGDTAPAWQRRFAARTRRPVAVAGFLWHRAEQPRMADLAIPLLRLIPGLPGLAARMTRIGD